LCFRPTLRVVNSAGALQSDAEADSRGEQLSPC
jgi:hypothetical protein